MNNKGMFKNQKYSNEFYMYLLDFEGFKRDISRVSKDLLRLRNNRTNPYSVSSGSYHFNKD